MAIFTNQATLSYNDTVTTSNIATGNLVDALEVTKTALSDSYSAGDTVTYVINLRNTGAAELTGVAITDDLGGYAFNTDTVYPLSYVDGSIRYFANGVLQTPDPAVTTEPQMTVSGITVPAGGNVQLIYEAQVNDFAPLNNGALIRNGISVTRPGRAAPLTAAADVAVIEEPVLSITKSLTPETVTENGTLTYTFVLQNRGNTAADAGDNVAVQDTFAPILNNLTASYNGAALTPTTDYSYDASTGVFSTVPGRLAVPAATFTQNPNTGELITLPGTGTLTVTGTV